MQTKLTYKTTTLGLHKYLQTTKDWKTEMVRKHENSKKLDSITKERWNYVKELNNEEQEKLNHDLPPTKSVKEMKQTSESEGLKNFKSTWKKGLFGQHLLRASNDDVDSNKNPISGCSGLKNETKGLIMAAKDQSLLTRNYQANLMEKGADERCRICTPYEETIDHLILWCPKLVPNEYLNRYNRVAQYLHWKICKSGSRHAKNWYEHQPEAVAKLIMLPSLGITADKRQ